MVLTAYKFFYTYTRTMFRQTDEFVKRSVFKDNLKQLTEIALVTGRNMELGPRKWQPGKRMSDDQWYMARPVVHDQRYTI